ncbi:hypothetical protein SAMN05192562_101666 [Kosakonia arachidis]|uniref:Uncharacterized protein n=1 Tax=Kosakonia arachidis TaxID=551989 RepID=A0A1I6YPQ6_9ENTR|nr:hypothetical protein [Kosakonia arachidis]SFT52434.1 hypothetical protein SAMN05192562_101666 [Kosakonia arachidis]
MDCRKANIALITIVSTLLIITCLVLIKFLFSGNEGFEWGSVSDWFSSIANLIMAGAALYAAWNAKNWFQTKIKENELNHVTKFWTNCDLFSLEVLKTYENVRNLNNTEPEIEPINYAQLVKTEREVIDQLQIKLVALKSELQSLTFWKVSPKDESVFEDYFFSNQLALEGLREVIGFDVNDIHERYHYNQNYGRMLVETAKKLRKTHASLKNDMNNLFHFSN